MSFLLKNSADRLVQICDLIDPTGLAYVTSGVKPGTPLSPYSIPLLKNVMSPNRSEAVTPGTGSLLVPNNPSLPSPRPGKWLVRIMAHRADATDRVSLHWRGKSQQEVATGRVLGVHLWIDPSSVWATRPAETSAMIQEATRLFAEIGIKLRVRSTQFLQTPASEALDVPADMIPIAQANNRANGINFYLMPTMVQQSKPVNGIACLGGPVGFDVPHGCFASMYAAANSDLISVQAKAKIFVHEIGHYLGLFHTQDTGYYRLNTVHDPLEDTPTEIDGRNMMDPGIHNESPSFSPMQRRMILLSPAIGSS